MRCGALLTLVVAGCGFQASPATGTPDAAATPGPGPDAGSGSGGPIDAPPSAPAAFCDPADPALVVCLDFDDGTLSDRSSHHFPIHGDHVAFLPGRVGKALSFTAQSAADIDDSSAFDVGSFTIEMWLEPTATPEDFANLLDVDQQYALQLRDDGSLHCIFGGSGKTLDGMAKVATGQWSHVACTYDGAHGTGALYINGKLLTTVSGGGPLTAKGNTGLSLGADNNPPGGKGTNAPGGDVRHRFVGLLDQFRLLGRARTATEICGDAGLTSCAP